MTLQIVNVVWGEKYVNTYLELTLPTQFSPGNLLNLKTKPKYIIYTDEEGKQQIVASSIYQKLLESTHLILRMIAIDENPCSFASILRCHSDAIIEANKTRSPIVFLAPDALTSTGVFTYIEEGISRGVRLIATCGLRMSLEKYQAIVKKRKIKPPDFAVNWSSRELAKMTVENLHHYTEHFIVKKNRIPVQPSHMFWRLDENHLLGKAYHVHPLMIWPKKVGITPLVSIDGRHFLERICPAFDEWDIVTDCSKISFFELSSDVQFIGDYTHTMDKVCFREWLRDHVTKSHRFFIKHNFILGESSYKPEWRKTIDHANHQLREFGRIDLKTLPHFIYKLYLVKLAFYYRKFVNLLTGKKKTNLKSVYQRIRFIIKYKSYD